MPPPTATRAKAVHSFDGQELGDLGFKDGDIIDIVDTTFDGWWTGEIGHRQGRFPYYYVVSRHDFHPHDQNRVSRAVCQEVIEKSPLLEETPRTNDEPHRPTARGPEVPAPSPPDHKPKHSAADSPTPVPPPRERRPVLFPPRLAPHPNLAVRPVRAVNVHQWSFAGYTSQRYGFRSRIWGS